jgi:hypothetical protein
MDTCPKCGLDWTRERKKLGIEWIKPSQRGWLESVLDQEAETGMRGIPPDDKEFHARQFYGHKHGTSAYLQEWDKTKGHNAPIMPQKESDSRKEIINQKKSSDSGQDYEIDYPDLEIIDSDENKPQNS